MRTRHTLFILFILTTMLQAAAQEEGKRRFTLEDLIPGGSTFYQHSYPETIYSEWWGDRLLQQNSETVDERKADESSDRLFTLNDINQALKAAQLPVVQHLYTTEFPYAGETLVLLNQPAHRVLVDWSNGTVAWKQPKHREATAEDWHAASRNLAFVRAHNLYVTTADGETHAVNSDGSIDLEYGESVHREEFGITKGTFWSPTGRLLAFYRMDQSMVTKYPQVDILFQEERNESRCAVTDPDPYPMAGETSHEVSVGIYDVQTQKTIYLQTGNPKDCYFTNLAWSPDEKTLYLIELNREQNHATLDAYDAQTGVKIRTLLEERNEKYVEPLHPIQFLPWDATKFIYQTRNRDGYNHLFLVSLTQPGRLQCLTAGTYEVTEVLGFCADSKSVIYASNEGEVIGQSLWSVDMKGRRHIVGAREGWHIGKLSESGEQVVDNWSWGVDTGVGRRIDLIDTQRNKVCNLLLAKEPWRRYDVPEIRVGTLKAADGVTDLYYRLILPTGFDPSRQYPAIVYVYGGPHAHNIDSSRHYGARGWDIWMAQQGYVMFCLDNRGSEHRGLAFEQATFRHLGVEEMKDQLKGIEFLKSLPYVDGERLGVHGWSYGGFMTTSLMTTYPDVFKVGVAGGPVIDWKYYEVMYGERYMDTPQTNAEGYEETSLLPKAGNLKGRLLLIYGGNDPTCVPQHTLSFIRACIDAGTHPDLFTYPGDGHNMTGTDRVHLHEHISRYFLDYLNNTQH